ncbi:MAG: NAD(+)/NADH kinase, partial [Lachnospiraceae bacterium]|nr:NAD(+)/NADH kinase [Lachnospiraceae bacterium]
HYEEAIDRIFAGEYQTEKRMMLSGNVLRQGKEAFFAKALNDITITRCGSLQIIRFSVYVNHQFLCKMSADGMIMATPTGSTGYNMSAGGPVIEPGAKMIVLTPICAHTLSARSIILRAEDEIEIEIDRGRDGTQLTVEASFDGNEKVPMVTGDRIIIRKSDETTAFMKLNELSFVEALHRKMSEE